MSLTCKTRWFDCSKFPTPSQNTTVFCDITDLPTDETRSIYLQIEPEAILGLRKHLLQNGKKYDYIITYDHVILRMFSHARKCIFGGCWIHPHEYGSIDVTQKQCKVSSIVGMKKHTEGHVFRLQLYKEQSKLPQVTFYRSSREAASLPPLNNNPVLSADSKFDLFRTFQFSLAIENSRQENYFTEKLIDCLITKTIPIYWGCPNVDDYFDTTGWIILETDSLDEVKSAVESLTPELYMKHKHVIDKNYETAKQYIDFHGRIREALLSIPNY